MPWNLFPARRQSISNTTIDLIVVAALILVFYGLPFLNLHAITWEGGAPRLSQPELLFQPGLLNPNALSYGGDAFSLLTPALEHYRASMFHGIVPLWNSNTWMGAPFLAAYQSAVLYPPQLLALVPGSAAFALNLCLLFSLYWLAAGGYFFGSRALELERLPSIFLAVLLSCSGFVGAHGDHVNQLAAISWIPWIMTAALLMLRTPRPRYAVMLAVFLGMQVLAGHPQHVVYTLAFLGMLMACYYVYYAHRRRIDDPPRGLGMLLLGLGVVAGLGLGAAQILPAGALSQLSLRQLDSPERMLAFSFPPKHLLTLFLPHAYGNPATGLHALNGGPYQYNYGEYVCHMGYVGVLLAFIAAAALFREFVVRCFLLLALVSLLIAFGSHAYVFYELAFFWFPGIEHMRVPARFLMYFVLSISVLAAVGYNQAFYYLSERRRVRRGALLPLRLLILALAFCELYLFSAAQSFRYPGSADILNQADDPHSLRAFALAHRGEQRSLRVMDEVPYDYGAQNLVDPEVRATRRQAARMQYQRLQPNLNMLDDVQICRGYEEGLLPTLQFANLVGQYDILGRYQRNVYSQTPDSELLGLLNVRYLFTDKPVFGAGLRLLSANAVLSNRSDDRLLFLPIAPEQMAENRLASFAVYENEYCLPRFAWAEPIRKRYRLEETRVSRHALDPTASVRRESAALQPVYDYRRPDPQTDVETMISQAAETIRFSRLGESPNSYVVSKARQTEGEVLMLTSYYPGWRCETEDGRELPVSAAGSLACSVEAPAGVERLTFAFQPFSYRLGLFISCLFTSILCAAAVFWKSAFLRSGDRENAHDGS